MNLVEFLEARIAEDEYDASRELLLGTTTVLTRMNTRVLAECAAKRKIMIEHKMVERADGMKRSIGCELCNFERDYGWNEIGPCQTLRALAAVYKDHPDYCEDWSSAT